MIFDKYYRLHGVGKELVFEEIPKPQEPKQGEWEKYGDKIEVYDIEGNKTWGQKRKCTNCDFIKTYVEDFGFYSICPNCGADMRDKNELNRVSNELNSEIEKSKGKILPDYCDGLLYSITNGDNFIGKEGDEK